MVYQINSIYKVLKLEQYFRKKKVVTGTTFSVLSDFSVLFVLAMASDIAVLYRNVILSILVLSTKNVSPVFWKGFAFFRRFILKLKYWNRSTFSSDCHIKTCYLSNGGLFQKSLVPGFRRICDVLFLGYKMKTLKKSVYDKNQLNFCRKPY